MKNRFVLRFLIALCMMVFAPQVWSGNVDTTAAYMTVFGRPATQVEIDYWKNRLPATQDELVEINMKWLVSPSGAKDLKETVVRGFNQVLGNDPNDAEQQAWQNKIKVSKLKFQDFTQALKASSNSGFGHLPAEVYDVDIPSAYLTVFGRPSTNVEFDYWKNRLPASQDELVEINLNWLVSPAGAKDLKETVVRGFQKLFQREPTAAEQQEWETKIKASRLKYLDFLNAASLAMPDQGGAHDLWALSYFTVFGRSPTGAESGLWQNLQPINQVHFEKIRMDYLVSPEGAAELIGVVSRGFHQVFQRSPTATEQQEWQTKIKTSKLKYQDFVMAVKGAAGADPGVVQYIAIPAPAFEQNPPGPTDGAVAQGYEMYAPLNLPDGAMIREFSCGVKPLNGLLAPNSSASIYFRPWAAGVSGHSLGDLDLTTHALADYVFLTKSFSEQGGGPIDNFTYRYSIAVKLTNEGKLWGCRIGYTTAH
jgi:hypothetical protein